MKLVGVRSFLLSERPSAADGVDWERLVDDFLKTVAQTRDSARSFVGLICDRFGRLGDDLTNFEELDIAVLRLAYGLAEYDRCFDRIRSLLPESDDSREDGEEGAARDIHEWVRDAKLIEESVRAVLIRLEVDDLYYITSSPRSRQITQVSMSEDLGEVFADCRQILRLMESVEDDISLVMHALSEIQLTYTVHTTRHLLDLQKAVAWNAGRHIR